MHIDLRMERGWEVWRRWVGAALVSRDHFSLSFCHAEQDLLCMYITKNKFFFSSISTAPTGHY